MKKIYKTGLLCLFALFPISFSTLEARRRYHPKRGRLEAIPTAIMQALPAKYILRLKNMPRRDQEEVILAYLAKKKDVDNMYLRFMFGLHAIDLQNIGSGIMCLCMAGMTLCAGALLWVEYAKFGWPFRPHIIFIDLILCCLAFSCLVIEYYRIPGLVKVYNEDTFEELLIERGF